MKIPEVVDDRSVNVLLFGHKKPPDFNLVISRDSLPKGERLDFIVKKQLDVISSSQKSFKQTAPVRERHISKQDGSRIVAKETSVSYKNQGTKYLQRHLYIPLDGLKIMIFAATVTSAWETRDETTWDNLINSIQLI
jgi:hypothetical protein